MTMAYSSADITAMASSNIFIANMMNQSNIYAENMKKMQEAQARAIANMPKVKYSYNKVSYGTANYSVNSNSNTTNYTNSVISNNNNSGSKINRNGDGYGPEFLAKVKQIAQRLNCDYKDLLAVMNAESGIRADAKNPNSSATGLIQFMESTARSLGTTTSALRQMSPLRQLDYVEKCLMTAKTRMFSPSHRLSGGELYALIFLPARANKEVLTASGEVYYKHNRGLDLNKDGKITKTELDNRVANYRVSDRSFLA